MCDRQAAIPRKIAGPALAEHGIAALHTVGDPQGITDPHIVEQQLQGDRAAIHARIDIGFTLQQPRAHCHRAVQQLPTAQHRDTMQTQLLIGGKIIDAELADHAECGLLVDLDCAVEQNRMLVSHPRLRLGQANHDRTFVFGRRNIEQGVCPPGQRLITAEGAGGGRRHFFRGPWPPLCGNCWLHRCKHDHACHCR